VEKIFILCHSNGHFSVWKEPGTGHGSPSSRLARRPMLAQRYCKTKREAPKASMSSAI
jgi:hypothetical protein